MKQKIIKVGNSAAVTIPQEFLKKSGWRIGEKVEVESDSDMGVMVIRDQESTYNTTITPEFKSWLDEISTKYESAIKELAQR